METTVTFWDPIFKETQMTYICPSMLYAYAILQQQYDVKNKELLSLIRPMITINELEACEKKPKVKKLISTKGKLSISKIKKSISFDYEFIKQVKKMLNELENIKGGITGCEKLMFKPRIVDDKIKIKGEKKDRVKLKTEIKKDLKRLEVRKLKKSKSLDVLRSSFCEVSKEMLTENIKKDEGHEMDKRNSVFLESLKNLVYEFEELKK